MFDVGSVIIQIQQQIIDMQKTNGLNWLKLFFQLIPPVIGLISPFIAFKLGFKNALALEKIKEINEKNKIKEFVENELSHESDSLKKEIKLFYDVIVEWHSFLINKSMKRVPAVSRNEYSFLSFDKYGVDYYCFLDFEKKVKLKNILSAYNNLNTEVLSLKEYRDEYLKIKGAIDSIEKVDKKKRYLNSIFDFLYRQISLLVCINDLLLNKNNKNILNLKIEINHLNEKLEQEFNSVGISLDTINSMQKDINQSFEKIKNKLKS